MNDDKRYEFRASIFKALANPLRLRILEKLSEKPWCVCALAAELHTDKSIISKYLSQLREVGLVEDEKRGTLVEYRLVAPCVLQAVSCAEQTIADHKKRILGELDSLESPEKQG